MIGKEKKKQLGLILAVLLIAGMIRVPFEGYLQREMRDAELLNPPLGASAISQMRSSAVFGVLGGLRSLVATYYVLEGYGHFENDEWDENRKSFLIATHLEPTEETHWVSLVWHRGINASAWAKTRSGLPAFQQELLLNEFAQDAVELGEKGLEFLPEAVDLRRQLADVYYHKLSDSCSAAEMYRQMIDLPDAPTYIERFYCYRLSECKGEEQLAYDKMLELYHKSDRNHLPTLIVKILELEQQLNIPSPQWIPEVSPDSEIERVRYQQRGKLTRRNQLPGGVVIY